MRRIARIGGMTYRPDIDGLRAVAVLAVIGFHAFPGWVPGGFVGVDVFFVISGYLISGLIIDETSQGRFSIITFYARRARRIFPALIAVLAAVLLFGWALFLPDELSELGRQIFAGALFSSNVLLWMQTGYFDTAASLKPLLHLWSLGIEEQFYILWPLVLLALPANGRMRLWLIGALLLASFVANLFLVHAYPSATFYLPATRAWELLIGAFLATLVREQRWIFARAFAWSFAGFAGAALILASTMVFTAETSFPGWAALVPTVGTLLLIAAGQGQRQTFLNARVLSHPIPVYIGRISYPLYLWHWPLLSIALISRFGEPLPGRARLMLVLIAFALAALTYSAIEKPIRFGTRARRVPAYLAGGIACMAAFGILAQPLRALTGLLSPREHASNDQFAWDYWKNGTCTSQYPWRDVHGWWFCITNSSAPPTVLLLGDSHANQLFPGLAQQAEFRSEAILSIGTCAPLDGIVEASASTGERPCAGERATQQGAFLKQLVREHPTIRLAILTAAWAAFDANGSEVDRITGVQIPNSFSSVIDGPGLSQRELYKRALDRQIAFLQDQGVKVAVVLATPELPYDPRSCFARPFHHATHDCTAVDAQIRSVQAQFREIVAEILVQHRDIAVFDPLPVFCSGATCRMSNESASYMRDASHLSVAGSLLVARAFSEWANQVMPVVLSNAGERRGERRAGM
jgi:peptidoglycan/LPS O-acetylase OafA/YrhL